MNDFLTSTPSNVQNYNPEESRNKRPALGLSGAETGAAMVFVHSLGQRDFVIHIGVGMHLSTLQVSAQTYI